MESNPPKEGLKKRLDRDLQRRMLSVICDAFPDAATDLFVQSFNLEDAATLRNLVYLDKHGLITLSADRTVAGEWSISGIEATEKGMDFMEQDGGLSAILGVVTVKLHEDTVRALLVEKITSSDLPAEQKETLLVKLKKLPGQSIELLMEKLLDRALDKAPDAIEWISTLTRSS